MKKQDLINKTFGDLLVVDESEIYISPKGYRKRMWKCRCICGNECVVMGSHLTSGHTTSCGCQRYKGLVIPKVKDLTNLKFGMLTVLYRQPNRMVGNNSRIVWRCKCDCGNETDVLSLLLTHGQTKSCGCLSISHAERIMTEFLINQKFDFIPQYYFDELLGINGGILKFDFAIFKNNTLLCLVELDGEHHFRPVEFFGGYPKFKQMNENDRLKYEYCVKHNINLIRIDVSNCRTDDSFINEYKLKLKEYIS